MTQKKSSKPGDEDIKIEEKEPEIDIQVEGESVESIAPTKAEPPKQEDDVEALKKQLSDLQNAQNLSKNRALEAELQAQQAAAQLAQLRQSAEYSQYESIVTALGAAQIEVDAAKRDIALSGQAQDYEGLANAQERLAAAKAHMVSLEYGKNNYEAQRGRVENPVINSIDANPNLTLEEKSWLKAHPDAMADSRKNAKLNAAYFDALDQGLQRGTRPYFDFIEERLGYRESPKIDKVQEKQEESPVMVAAPPSRGTHSGTGTGGDGKRYTMTKEEAEIAKLSGITPQEYVIQREKFKKIKGAHPGDYPER